MAEQLKKITIKGSRWDFARDTMIIPQGAIMEMRSLGFRVDIKQRIEKDFLGGEYPVDLFTPAGHRVAPGYADQGKLQGILLGSN